MKPIAVFGCSRDFFYNSAREKLATKINITRGTAEINGRHYVHFRDTESMRGYQISGFQVWHQYGWQGDIEEFQKMAISRIDRRQTNREIK